LVAGVLIALLAAVLSPWAHPSDARAQSKSEAQPPAAQQPPPTTSAPQTPASPPATPPKQAGVDDDEVLSVETNLVNILFNAVDKDRRFVTTLAREDVRVFENDAPQEVSIFQRETELPLSLAILVDVSGSQEVTLVDEKIAAREFIESVLRPGKDKAAIVSFTGAATIEQDLTADRGALNEALTRLAAVPPATQEEESIYRHGENADVVPAQVEAEGLPGSTALWDAVWATAHDMMSGTPQNIRRAIIILSDGDDTSSRVKKEEAAEAAVKANTIVYAIGVKPICDDPNADCRFEKGALKKISEATGGHAFIPEDETQLRAAFAEIEQELRTQYLVAYTPTNKARDGSWRRVRLDIVNKKLRDQKIKLSYRDGYFASPPQARAPKRERAPQERLKRPPRKPKKN
jgi:VWFA-related protein